MARDMFEDFLGRGWSPDWNTHPARSHLEMVIVEPRNHDCLRGVLANMSCMLPNAALTVIHSKENAELVEDIVKKDGPNEVRLLPIFDANISRTAYSDFLLSIDFWKMLRAPKTLIFQTDSGMRFNNILRFMEYDYVGAPWSGPVCENQNIRVGNGGFSLRNKSLMEDIILKNPYKPPQNIFVPEDVYFGSHMGNYHDANVPSIYEASMFSLEYIRHPNPMAFHQAWRLDGHDPDYIATIMTENIAPPTFSKNIVVLDAWIETQHGFVCNNYDLASWLSLGISTEGFRLSKNTKIACVEKDPFPGHAKTLKVVVSIDGQGRLYTAKLHHNRMLDDMVV